jgi:asparagine synthase (glutamine-hydrolysing)
MCGIAGIIEDKGGVEEKCLHRMMKALAHRGPDDKGITILQAASSDISVGLAHRRLSIIDLSPDGRQPMSNEDGSVWISYNGEIYNYRELRTELTGKGYRFRSKSDTEALIHAYEEWGIKCLEKLRGMFSFAVWDGRKQRLFMAVDRFGIKPLYYFHRLGTFLFASEVRTLLQSGLVEKLIEPAAVDSYLSFGAVQAPLTIIRGIRSLLPAHYMLFEPASGSTDITPYWHPGNSPAKLMNETEAVEAVRTALEESIRTHLVSDVPVGLFLSGGIDSSSVVAIANGLHQKDLQSFSVTFPEKDHSEEEYSRLIAGLYCRNHHEIRVSESDLLDLIPASIEAMDQPTVDGVNVYAISKAVRESGIKVVLSGQGGDEVFGGYSTFRRIPLIRKMHAPLKFLPLSLKEKTGALYDALTDRKTVRSKVSQIMESPGDLLSLYVILRQLFSPRARGYLLNSDTAKETWNGIPLEALNVLSEEIRGLDMCSAVSLLEFRLYMANMLLRDGDFMSMAHGLEVRVPFLDHHLADLVFGMPARLKMNSGLTKPLLVKAMGDLLPPAVYRRPKMGFTFPWEIWLKRDLRPGIESAFDGHPQDNEIGLDMKACRKVWQMFLSGVPGITWSRIWAIYVLLEWHKRNIVQ